MASVTYEHVTKVFGADTAAVRDLSLQIEDGEFMVLAGLEEITAGTIRIGDRVVNDVPPRDRDIAMVFQNYALYPHMSVFDNMAFGLKMRGMPRAETKGRVTKVADMLGLDALLERKPAQLSGGQRQRVALGRAIVREPRVFLLDEPLSNLDAALRGETRINLQRLHRDLQTTFVYVTHDQVEAMTMGTRIAVMHEGVLQQVAPPRELYDHPINMYVAGFIGSPRMNFIPVTCQGAEARASGFTLQLPRAVEVEQGVLGIRPEDLSDDRREGAAQVNLRVDVVEALGPDQYLYGKIGEDEVIARVDPHFAAAAGDLVPLTINLPRIHLFNATTELTLI